LQHFHTEQDPKNNMKHTHKEEKQIMRTNYLLITRVLFAALLLAGCGSGARVGELRSESQSVDLDDAKSVRVEINMGAGDLEVTGGADQLLEADFTYNVDKLKPEVKYTDGTLVVWQPGAKGLSVLRDITDYRNEWGLRLNNEVPMDLSVDVGAGSSDLRLADLSLTGLAITLGAGGSTIDPSGDWARDLDVTINAGAGDIIVRLPRDVGTRVQVDAGVGTIESPGLEQDGNIYTNATYRESDMTLHVDIDAGVGQINLEVAD
jgi:outer membrane murein-binding lipoprotein Lpp